MPVYKANMNMYKSYDQHERCYAQADVGNKTKCEPTRKVFFSFENKWKAKTHFIKVLMTDSKA